jgi:hypothetical protein
VGTFKNCTYLVRNVPPDEAKTYAFLSSEGKEYQRGILGIVKNSVKKAVAVKRQRERDLIDTE